LYYQRLNKLATEPRLAGNGARRSRCTHELFLSNRRKCSLRLFWHGKLTSTAKTHRTKQHTPTHTSIHSHTHALRGVNIWQSLFASLVEHRTRQTEVAPLCCVLGPCPILCFSVSVSVLCLGFLSPGSTAFFFFLVCVK